MLREDSFLFPFFQMDTEKRRGKEESVLTCRFTTDTAILVGEVLQAMRLVKIYKDQKRSIFNASVGINTDIRQ